MAIWYHLVTRDRNKMNAVQLIVLDFAIRKLYYAIKCTHKMSIFNKKEFCEL